MNRRAFLSSATMAAFGSIGATWRKKVVVVGAGLAGLSCAYELRKRGFEVVILEGQQRPGGRVQTIRQGLHQGLTAEAGATRIPDSHHLTLSYVHDFRLTVDPFHEPNLPDVIHLRGRNYLDKHTPELNWPLQLSPEERRLGRDGLAERYLIDALKLSRESQDSLDVPRPILALDRFTLYEYLARQGLSPDAIELITVGADTTISAALLLLVELNAQVSHGYYHIRGGNDRLPSAIASRLGGALHYGRRVTTVSQDDMSAWAMVEHSSGYETVRGDYVVFTLPFSVAHHMFTDARLSSEKQRVIQDLKYFPADKVFLQMRRQFWRSNGQSGFALSDLLSERFWAMGSDSPSEPGLLFSYCVGKRATKLDELDEASRVEQTLSDAEDVFPGARESFETAVSKSWVQDPWQQGGLSAFGPGQLSFIPMNARREGRIFFAGEHTSRWNGWMQGAIESAHRVAEEIVIYSQSTL